MTPPKNQVAEVLYELLHNSPITRVSILSSTGILNLTARISDLRTLYGINVTCEKISVKNKFFRPVSYGSWSIKGETETLKATRLYEKINKTT